MTLGAFLKSCLDRVDRFERAMDFDPDEAQAVRFNAIEAKLAELDAGRAPTRPQQADEAPEA